MRRLPSEVKPEDNSSIGIGVNGIEYNFTTVVPSLSQVTSKNSSVAQRKPTSKLCTPQYKETVGSTRLKQGPPWCHAWSSLAPANCERECTSLMANGSRRRKWRYCLIGREYLPLARTLYFSALSWSRAWRMHNTLEHNWENVLISLIMLHSKLALNFAFLSQ